MLSHPGGMRLCTECGTQTHTVKSMPTKPPAFDTQSVGKDSSFLRRTDQVCITSCFGIAFRPYFGCVILQSSSSLVFITSIHLFLTSRVGDINLINISTSFRLGGVAGRRDRRRVIAHNANHDQNRFHAQN